ncbi:hypothetical protein D0T12_13540 [Actinomadura spongiicola]|uniref:Transposase IS701-like DDE domain-containing protein n=1 Tax=Actinomadura spongiicola TaxID=2303421 RepID=A0A372GGS7_9ACTN|nr:hypothetical protein D0T12_13540 [Actinomadura spongiicola]
MTNRQIGVFCSYVSPDRQRVLIDRELYLPEPWLPDPGRLAGAGVPERARFETRPEMAWRVIERAADDPLLLFGWVTGDEAYGDHPQLRRCASRGANSVFAVSCDHPVVLGGAAPGLIPPSPQWVRRRGSGARAGTGPGAAAGTTGRGSAWTSTRANTNGCWPADQSATPPTRPSTGAGPTGRSASPNWYG